MHKLSHKLKHFFNIHSKFRLREIMFKRSNCMLKNKLCDCNIGQCILYEFKLENHRKQLKSTNIWLEFERENYKNMDKK